MLQQRGLILLIAACVMIAGSSAIKMRSRLGQKSHGLIQTHQGSRASADPKTTTKVNGTKTEISKITEYDNRGNGESESNISASVSAYEAKASASYKYLNSLCGGEHSGEIGEVKYDCTLEFEAAAEAVATCLDKLDCKSDKKKKPSADGDEAEADEDKPPVEIRKKETVTKTKASTQRIFGEAGAEATKDQHAEKITGMEGIVSAIKKCGLSCKVELSAYAKVAVSVGFDMEKQLGKLAFGIAGNATAEAEAKAKAAASVGCTVVEGKKNCILSVKAEASAAVTAAAEGSARVGLGTQSEVKFFGEVKATCNATASVEATATNKKDKDGQPTDNTVGAIAKAGCGATVKIGQNLTLWKDVGLKVGGFVCASAGISTAAGVKGSASFKDCKLKVSAEAALELGVGLCGGVNAEVNLCKMIDAIFAGADYKVCDPCPANIITEAWYQKLYPNGRHDQTTWPLCKGQGRKHCPASACDACNPLVWGRGWWCADGTSQVIIPTCSYQKWNNKKYKDSNGVMRNASVLDVVTGYSFPESPSLGNNLTFKCDGNGHNTKTRLPKNVMEPIPIIPLKRTYMCSKGGEDKEGKKDAKAKKRCDVWKECRPCKDHPQLEGRGWMCKNGTADVCVDKYGWTYMDDGATGTGDKNKKWDSDDGTVSYFTTVSTTYGELRRPGSMVPRERIFKGDSKAAACPDGTYDGLPYEPTVATAGAEEGPPPKCNCNPTDIQCCVAACYNKKENNGARRFGFPNRCEVVTGCDCDEIKMSIQHFDGALIVSLGGVPDFKLWAEQTGPSYVNENRGNHFCNANERTLWDKMSTSEGFGKLICKGKKCMGSHLNAQCKDLFGLIAADTPFVAVDPTARPCSADFGRKKDMSVCCKQSGAVKKDTDACPWEYPECRGYKNPKMKTKTWGKCGKPGFIIDDLRGPPFQEATGGTCSCLGDRIDADNPESSSSQVVAGYKDFTWERCCLSACLNRYQFDGGERFGFGGKCDVVKGCDCDLVYKTISGPSA